MLDYLSRMTDFRSPVLNVLSALPYHKATFIISHGSSIVGFTHVLTAQQNIHSIIDRWPIIHKRPIRYNVLSYQKNHQ